MDQVQWVAPASFWSERANATDVSARQSFRQPAIFRFASDNFMDEFISLLNTEPARMRDYLAEPETWRVPSITPTAPTPHNPLVVAAAKRRLINGKASNGFASFTRSTTTTLPAISGTAALQAPPELVNAPLKLYQPAHQRFYLVGACLVCRVPGLPDRTLDTNAQERVSFVVRRLRRVMHDPPIDADFRGTPDSTWEEFAFVGPEGQRVWQRVTDANILVTGEEQLPLFGVNYVDSDRRRRLLAGMIPVAKREVYLGGRVAASQATADPETDPRYQLFVSQVIAPWQRLYDEAKDVRDRHADETRITEDLGKLNTEYNLQVGKLRDRLLESSWNVLVEFADFLIEHMPAIWGVLLNAPSSIQNSTTLTTAEKTFAQTLYDTRLYLNNIAAMRLSEALRQAIDSDVRATLDRQGGIYTYGAPGYPSLYFPLADPVASSIEIRFPAGITKPDDWKTIARPAFSGQPKARIRPIPVAAQPMPDGRDRGWFIIRCVFERPHCGPLQPTLVSDGSVPFQLANFFDSDAPARPIRIALPIDTTPAGLRKFDKNTAFMISDSLHCQMEKLGKLSLGDLVLSVLPWPFHKDLSVDAGCDAGLSFGLICSISIPIITICALILLMIIVSLLDLIFHWIPFFILCIPFPGLKAKE